ncbi:hypothetical protein MUCCIDRAFT_76065 [Mucor lusitanicus CBS 277.49]|uniref:Uncharacterized protein n=1 Tax=Mucor lusitanicus CBS 277.49 TaxID=747725 RepID=A0A168QCY6_MUCCL|nr:hypothetical protein MUCCIDRAFT_76065 [Mucor lusitanicus CBS 277.49]
MKACVCVDYLSHEWSSTDLIQAYRELQRQKSKTQFTLITKQHTGTAKELKKLSIELNKQIRYQNAIWRQMARSCTQRLSHSNQMIHPSTVNWQKESDVTWLYGPLYMPPDEPAASSDKETNTHPSLSFNTNFYSANKTLNSLKPVLKKNTSTSSILLQKDYWRINDRHWSKCVSESGKQSVRFNPDITEVKFLPETPVKESFKTCYFSLDSDGEEEDDDQEADDELWKVVLQVGSYIKSVLFSSLFGGFYQKRQQQHTTVAKASKDTQVVQFLFKCVKD